MSDEEKLESANVQIAEDIKANDEPAPEGQPELAPEPAPEPETKPEGEEKPLTDGAQKAINKQYRLRKEAEEREAETQRRLQALQAEFDQARGTNAEPQIPPMPDQYDEDYDQKLVARDAAIQAHGKWVAEQNYNVLQQQALQQQAQEQQAAQLNEAVNSFTKKGEELQVNKDALAQAFQTVVQSGIPDDIGMMLLKDPDGPLMFQKLATDYVMLDQLSSMDPVSAGAFIERTLRPQAAALRPRTSETPPPAETLTGGGEAEADLLEKSHPNAKYRIAGE